MDTLVDIYKKEQIKEKKLRNILIVAVCMLSAFLIYLFTVDPWDIAYEKEADKIKEREDEFLKVLDSKLADGEYLEAYYIENDLDFNERDYDLWYLLYDYKDVVENIRNTILGNDQHNYYDLEYLLDSFYSEYFYIKKYQAPSNYIDDIKDEVEEYLFAYELITSDKLNEIKGRNVYE